MSQRQPTIVQIPLSRWLKDAPKVELNPWYFRFGLWAAKWTLEARQGRCQHLDFGQCALK